MSGSNVQSARVTNTTSKHSSKATHIPATASSGAGCSSAAVPRTPAMMTGTVIGYNRIGSMTPRVDRREADGAGEQQGGQQQRAREQRRAEQERDKRHEHQFGDHQKEHDPE